MCVATTKNTQTISKEH